MGYRRTQTTGVFFLGIALSAVGAGCGPRNALDGLRLGDDPGNDPGSGRTPWTGGGSDAGGEGAEGSDRDLSDPSCTSTANCLMGEICLDNVCQMERCAIYGDSAPPLGESYTFFWDRELVVADGSNWLNGYSPDIVPMPEHLVGGESYWSIGTDQIVDVVGGNFLEGRPDELAVAAEDRSVLTVVDGNDTIAFDLGFAATALAASDLDQDGLDELIATGANGSLAICRVASNACELVSIPGITVVDATAGDLDADGYAEVVLVFDSDGSRFFYVFNADHETTDQQPVIVAHAPDSLLRIAAGDIDGDGVDEALGLHNGSQSGDGTRTLAVFRLRGETMPSTSTISVAWDATDVAVGSFGGQHTEGSGDSIAVVRGAGYVDVYEHGADGDLAFGFSALLYNIGSPARVAFADYDGDSPKGRLVEGPIRTPGRIVPTMVMQMPPYDREHSDGTSSVSIGDGTSASESRDASVAYSMSISVGVRADLFNIFSAGVSRGMARSMTLSRGVSHSITIGSEYSVVADPHKLGVSQASVVLASGCFLNFIYDIDDPAGRLVPPEKRDAEGRALFSVLVPVGGQSALWAVDRFNAMANRVGGLPTIDTNGFRSGDLTSYPDTPSRPDGTPVAASDQLFPTPPSFAVSDVGSTSWSVSVAANEVNGTAQSVSMSTGVTGGVLGFNYGQDAGRAWAESYSVSVGSSATFGGTIPPIPNRVGTPSDEYVLFRYSFRPFVYLQRYTSVEGKEAAYYMISYSVGG